MKRKTYVITIGLLIAVICAGCTKPVQNTAPTPTDIPVETITPTNTLAPTATNTPMPTEEPVNEPTLLTPTVTPEATPEPTNIPDPTATNTPVPTATPSPTEVPTVTPTPTVDPTETPLPTATSIPILMATPALSAEEQINNINVADSWKEELFLAAYMGLPMENLDKETITGVEMVQLLDAFISYTAPEKLNYWRTLYPVLRSYNKPLMRIDALAAYYLAASCVGGDYLHVGGGFSFGYEEKRNALFGESDCPNWELFGEMENIDLSQYGMEGAFDHYGVAACYHNLHVTGLVDGENLLTYDEAGTSFHVLSNATYLDAMMIIARAISAANPEFYTQEISNEEKQLAVLVQEKYDVIMNSASDWTVAEGGTVYYVSPNGDDNNDGLSPETAWKSLGKINSAAIGELDCNITDISIKSFPQYQWAKEHSNDLITLNPGDVVLFERGGTWRGSLATAKGVTYSAYGAGKKPLFLGSPENGAGAEKWTLLDGTENIWVYYKEIQDCGGILLDESTVAIKCAPFWDFDAGIWLDYNGRGGYSEADAKLREEFKITSLKNLQFFNELQEITPEYPAWCWGKLYMRCDEGNPGEIFDSIEFFTGLDNWGRCTFAAESVILDNLEFKCFGGGIHMDEYSVVQNCSMQYIGGIVQEYTKNWYGLDIMDSWDIVRCGDGIGAGKPNTTATNNYIAYCYDFGITVESGIFAWTERQEELCRNIKVTDNLIAHSAGGVLLTAWDAMSIGYEAELFKDIYIEDNYIFNTGDCWSHAKDAEEGIMYNSPIYVVLNPGSNSVYVQNNVMYRTWDSGQLINYEYYNGWKDAAVFTDNTFVAINGLSVAAVCIHNGDSSERIFIKKGESSSLHLEENLGDAKAKVITRELAFTAPE